MADDGVWRVIECGFESRATELRISDGFDGGY